MELKWSSQRAIANSRIVKSSAIWLIIVPFAAKALSSLDDVLELTILNATFKFSTILPFSWQLLFFSASFFTLAGIVYSIFCPEIVKSYNNYTQFENDGKTRLQINSAFKKIIWDSLNNRIKKRDIPTAKKYFTDYTSLSFDDSILNKDNGLHLFEDINQNSGKNSNAFYFVYSVSDIHLQSAIVTSLALYIIGFIFIGVIAIENIRYVFDTFLIYKTI